jgi:urease accessory protein
LIPLLLADGRFPSGGHAHSGGVEAAVGSGRVGDLDSLRSFLHGRLSTTGRVAAGLAAAACTGRHDLAQLDAEAAARTASAALRGASRQQGRLLLRAAGAVWPAVAHAVGKERELQELHHPVAVGVVARRAGMAPVEAARWAAYDAVTGPAAAAVRLLGLDPFAVWAAVAALALAVEEVAAEAAAATLTDDGLDRLPSCSAPLLEFGAERHSTTEGRLFAS